LERHNFYIVDFECKPGIVREVFDQYFNRKILKACEKLSNSATSPGFP